ncbi:MAG: TadE/TadG family type IV pilus assembly protein [Rhodospirillales bacterium]
MIGMIGRVLRRLKRDRRGTLAVEMAVATPVVVGLLLSGIEVTRYVLLNQKIERASATMADLVSQAETLSEGGLINLFSATAYVMDPFDLAADGRLVVSSISGDDDNRARINWQRSFGGGSGGSAFGVEGGRATLPAGFVVRDKETVVVTEVFYDYVPAFLGTQLVARNLYNYAVFRPRFSALATLNP